MGAFTPFQRHAKEFKYTPRYYDPQKEAREQRRAELRGERLDDVDEGGEYRPGQYIRRQSAARASRREVNREKGGKSRTWMSIVVLVVVALFGAMLYNKILEAFGLSEGSTSRGEARVEEYEEFNPYTPIVIVPNDYDPTKEE